MNLQERTGRILLVILLAAGLSACMEDPSPVGAGLLPSSDFLDIDTLSTPAIRSYTQSAIPLPSTTRLLVGNLDDVESWGVIRFFVLPDSIQYLPMVSAEIVLRAAYHFGDSLAPFSLTAHKVLKSWGTDSLTIDSLQSAGFFDPAPAGTLTLPSVGDTSFVSIPIDTTVVRSWGTISDTTYQNFGVLLRPTNSRVVKGFAMFDVINESQRPKLLMRFLRSDQSGNVDTLTLNTGISRFTVRVRNTSWTSDTTHVYVYNGPSYRGVLEFDISGLPEHAAIHRAHLELTLDPAKSRFNSYTVDSTFAFFVNDDGVVVTSIFETSESIRSVSASIHRYSVGQIVQRWVRGVALRKIAIAGFGEANALDVFSFHATGAPEGLKPKLTIVYSVVR